MDISFYKNKILIINFLKANGGESAYDSAIQIYKIDKNDAIDIWTNRETIEFKYNRKVIIKLKQRDIIKEEKRIYKLNKHLLIDYPRPYKKPKPKSKKRPFRIFWARTKKRSAEKGQTDFFLTPEQLWQLAYKQRLKCAITGKKLDKTNISLDHKIPISKGGFHDISNLQFVTRTVNFIKGSLSMEELLNICTDIIEFNKDKINIELNKID